MESAQRVSQTRIRRVYARAASGVCDDGLLLEVGWGLYARCAHVLQIVHAVRGEVPCPRCGRIVHRTRVSAAPGERRPAPEVACPRCQTALTWDECRDALRRHPLCFRCHLPLEWDYQRNQLRCPLCAAVWSWPRYRASLSRRVWLACPHCREFVRRPDPPQRIGDIGEGEDVACPRCGAMAHHAEGKLRCPHCGYERRWAVYRKRTKRRRELLTCPDCGMEFTWEAWRKRYRGLPLLTGNPGPIERFLDRWPRCETGGARLVEVDALLHALHGRGAMAPLLVEGDEASVMGLLNELAGDRNRGRRQCDER